MEKSKKINVGILGATGMVGQRLITLLNQHPYFKIKILGASPRSAGKKYIKVMQQRWSMDTLIPNYIKEMTIFDVQADIEKITEKVDLVFCALDIDKKTIREIENNYAKRDIVVVSNNSANRWENDIPMIMPEINADHLDIIPIQKKNRGFNKGFIIVKPNCSIQSYVPLLTPLLKYGVEKASVTTMQAISGAGKTFTSWPEMLDNVIPLISGEEEKSEKEPTKIWGEIKNNIIENYNDINISATCTRVPVSDGHMASISFSLSNKISKEEILELWQNFNPLKEYTLPSSPKQFITYFEKADRPQTRLDRNLYNGMGISAGRLREDNIFDYKVIGLSHNTVRGAAGGSVLNAELLVSKGLI